MATNTGASQVEQTEAEGITPSVMGVYFALAFLLHAGVGLGMYLYASPSLPGLYALGIAIGFVAALFVYRALLIGIAMEPIDVGLILRKSAVALPILAVAGLCLHAAI